MATLMMSQRAEYELKKKNTHWKERRRRSSPSPTRRRSLPMPRLRILLTSPKGTESCILNTIPSPMKPQKYSPVRSLMDEHVFNGGRNPTSGIKRTRGGSPESFSCRETKLNREKRTRMVVSATSSEVGSKRTRSNLRELLGNLDLTLPEIPHEKLSSPYPTPFKYHSKRRRFQKIPAAANSPRLGS
mmetsp:Transcript_19427/g.36588  ORF Transcript_19427/g.36588 Transcript_19427/m.36588 type:complete len:187 (+) Transcript_19427:86-646(+)